MIIVLLLCSLVGLLSSTVYLGLTTVAAYRFARGRREAGESGDALVPPVSVLKPVHGDEPCLLSSLESFFQQRYDRYELIFGARTADDPALAVVETLRRKYPQVPTRVVLAGPPIYPNAKISALEAMIEAATHSYLLIADSDTRVAPHCLHEVTAPLSDPQVGLVTCLYRGVSIGGVSARLEALGMSVEMPSGVLVANMLEGMRFALGPTIATRKDELNRIGGIGTLGEYCADDYVLGRLIWQSGHQVVLSHHVVDHVIVNQRWRASLDHQVRWMRSTRFSRPLGHLGTGLTFAMPFGALSAIAAMLSHHSGLGLALAAWAYASGVAQSVVVGFATLGDRQALSYCWLYPLRDLVGFALWCVSYTGTSIVWRGERYELLRGGRMRADRVATRRRPRPLQARTDAYGFRPERAAGADSRESKG
jgi:ceramide glucosyltransferase